MVISAGMRQGVAVKWQFLRSSSWVWLVWGGRSEAENPQSVLGWPVADRLR